MRIAAAARALGISISTMKRLEHKGVIQVQRDKNNQRRFTDRDIATIRRLYYPTVPDTTAGAPDTEDRSA